MERLECILQGIRKSQCSASVKNINHKRFPITFTILSQLCKLLSAGLLSPYTDIMLKCVYLMAFYGFLRWGEFTIRNSCDSDYITIRDIMVSDIQSSYDLPLRKSKTDPCRQGVHIYILWCIFSHSVWQKILQEAQVCLNRTQEHKTQTADKTIFYLAKGFEGLYLECYRNPTKLLLHWRSL